MRQLGDKTVKSSDGGPAIVLGRQQLHSDCPGFNEWIDPSTDVTDTEVSHLVNNPATTTSLKNNSKRCCKSSTSSGYSSHSPPLSAASYYSTCCPTPGILRNSSLPHHRHHHHHHHHPHQHHHHANRASRTQNQQTIGPPGLAIIHETETIPRPIWPCMSDDLEDIRSREMIDCQVAGTHGVGGSIHCKQNVYACCDYCCSSYAYRDTYEATTTSTAREVLLELSRTLNSVIEAETDLTAEEILRDISITVARGINQPKETAGICEDYTYRLSSSSSSAGGKESSVGVNPVNLRVYGKPKWLHVPASSRSSSHCPYEGKTLLTAAQKASRTIPAFGDTARVDPQRKNGDVAPSVFLVPQANSIYPNSTLSAYRDNVSKVAECDEKQNVGSRVFGSGLERTTPIGRLNVRPNENCADKCPAGEPVYSTQLDGSDESSSYGAIGDLTTKTGWNDSSKVFDRHLDFTLDGNRAERLGRAIAKAKRKRQWCRGLTAILGLVFFILSVVVVSLSVTRGRKVFGSM